ncbi:hypothetical protein BDV95DRAFT_482729 [Massariosphaeria phaeospora]|uniref:Uncharacterized protein n=1 Tax=Massariosphaeria phaeospora TaxID=100035 RepID=A0A7C8MGL8_9PLEO|nr:hypothetical protein BDV95DRAFT_482729 [Massariosphaeria phaeospora]
MLTQKRRIHRWKSPLLIATFFSIGFAMILAHCVLYAKLSGRIVGDSASQEEKIRFGTAFAFLTQICLSSSIWAIYTQWFWRIVKKTELTVAALNAAFGVDTSALSLLNPEMIRKVRIGSAMPFFAWTLLLLPFFTPATLCIYPSTDEVQVIAAIPYPDIASSNMNHKFAYSPPQRRGTIQFLDDKSGTFIGPRTILSTLSAATASLGDFLPIDLPFKNSAYSVTFFAPIIKCEDANSTDAKRMDDFLQEEMATKLSTNNEINSAYYGFVPTYNDTGHVFVASKPRQQTPSRATNQLWITFLLPIPDENGKRIKNRHYQICQPHNASYGLTISRQHGYQNVSGSYDILDAVPYPDDGPNDVSDMSYTAFIWAISDQLVGRLAWSARSNQSDTRLAEQFGIIDTPLRNTNLLGSLDLDAFYEFDEDYTLYANENRSLSDQRLQDKAKARNRTLDVLIEELSFNTTVSLMHNSLLTLKTSSLVHLTNDVNRYAYRRYGHFVPYALANLLTLVILIVGIYSYVKDGVMPDRKVQDILSAVKGAEIAQAVRSRKRSVTAVVVGGEFVLRAGPARVDSGGKERD